MKPLPIITILILCFHFMHGQETPSTNELEELLRTDNTEFQYLTDSIIKYGFINELDSNRVSKEVRIHDDQHNTVSTAVLTWNLSALQYDSMFQIASIYDANNQPTEVTLRKAVDGTMDYELKRSYRYNAAGNYVSKHYYQWNAWLSNWTSGEAFTYQYDENQNITQILFARQQGTDTTWINQDMVSWTYDDSNKPLEKTVHIFDPVDNQWILEYQSIFNHNPQLRKSIETRSYPQEETTTLIPSLRIITFTNEYGSTTLSQKEYYDDQNDLWALTQEIFYEYNIDNLRTHYSYRQRNGVNGSWYGVSYHDYAYSEEGNEIEHREKTWDHTIGDWINASLATTDYTVDGKYYVKTYSTWDTNEQAWSSYLKREMYNDENDSPFCKLQYHMDESNQWILDSKDYYYNNLLPTDGELELTASQNRLLYPNPAKDRILFFEPLEQGTQIEIWTVNGQLIQKQSASEGQVKLDIRSIPAGIYILTIKQKDMTQSQKLMIQ